MPDNNNNKTATTHNEQTDTKKEPRVIACGHGGKNWSYGNDSSRKWGRHWHQQRTATGHGTPHFHPSNCAVLVATRGTGCRQRSAPGGTVRRGQVPRTQASPAPEALRSAVQTHARTKQAGAWTRTTKTTTTTQTQQRVCSLRRANIATCGLWCGTMGHLGVNAIKGSEVGKVPSGVRDHVCAAHHTTPHWNMRRTVPSKATTTAKQPH